ncbi:MAG: hypothetical protein WC881_04995 [Elusimicrobiota bacterium]
MTKAIWAVGMAGLLSVTGCMHYTLKPEPPASMPHSDATLPLRVGLVLDEQRSALTVGNTTSDLWQTKYMLENKGYSLAPKFAQALRQSKLFQDVRYPMRLTRQALEDVDLILSAQFGYKFVQDPIQGLKIVFVCFTGFITGAVLRETSHHIAQGVVSLEDAAGRSIKTYDETMDVTADSMVSMFAEMKTMEKGPAAAADNLIAKLVQGLIDDRALLERSAKAARPAPLRVEPAVEAGTGAADRPPVSSDAVPAAPAAPAAPEPIDSAPVEAPKPKPKPAITPEMYDDQLLP